VVLGAGDGDEEAQPRGYQGAGAGDRRDHAAAPLLLLPPLDLDLVAALDLDLALVAVLDLDLP